MPEIGNESLAVSAEEERYLRGAFRRFAAPYLVAVAVLALAVTWGAISVHGGPATSAEDAALERAAIEATQAEISALREELARVVERLDGLDRSLGGAAKKLSRLESRVEQPASGSAVGAREVAALGQSVEETRKRLELLEEQVRDSGVRFPAALDAPANFP